MEEVCIPPHVYTTFFEGSAVLLDGQKNIYYALNDSAADFWSLLIKSGSLEETLKEISYLYEVSSDILIKDMDVLVNSFLKAGLLEIKRSNL
ncbi:PqqD family protein [Nostoc sp. MG11]|uniref:PqqD family protein n=1 Tax=Nostoc sp. MG11 TaxID=2721166 RepID=UPI0018676F89|nr:PqqD family protein [Nostoc sp. MG11]